MTARSGRGPLIAGLILISIGVIFFIENWYAGFSAWRLVSRYWPLILIIIGLNKLYGYFIWMAIPAEVDQALHAASAKKAKSPRPSLLGGLLWTSLGVVFLLRNFGIGPDFWSIARRYWPILLILLGLGKIIDYFRQKDGVSLRFGEVFGILFLILIGSALTRLSNSNVGQLLEDMPVRFGDAQISPGKWLGNSYTYTQEVSYQVNPSAPLQIENAHGQVSLSPGSDREVRIRLRKVVYHTEEARAKDIGNEIKLEGGMGGKVEAAPLGKAEAELSAKQDNASFVIRTNRDELSAKNYHFDTDMEIFVPKKAQVIVRNSFGEIKASNLEGKLDLSTSHNPIDVRDCSGEFNISNKFAEARLANLTGNLTVDSRGRVYIETVRGNVNVRDEYSPVEIRDVDGKVTVNNTESSIFVEKATKPVVIEGRGSQVTVRSLESTLKVSASHRQVRISDIASDVNLESRYANATLKSIRGNVDIASNSDRLSLEDIRGYLKIKGQGSAVQATSVGGAIDIATTLRSVTVNNFDSGCKIANEYADVSVSTGTLGKGEINVKNRNGEIQLLLPEDASFLIDALARNGRVDSDFQGLEPVKTAADDFILKGRLKTGATKIVLETEYNSIHLRTRSAEKQSENARERKRRNGTI